MSLPRVFTVPAGAPFLSTLADALIAGDPVGGWREGETLADATIYLPTRRAGRALSRLLVDRAPGGALLLPRIVPLAEIEAPDEGGLPGAGAGLAALSPLERRLILARLVQAWAAGLGREADGAPLVVPASPAEALGLAADLEGLMDSLAVEGIDWSALEEAVEIDYSRYFALTLRFVRIAHEAWPAILADRGAADPARLQHEAIGAEARRVAGGLAGPVVAAGSTGSVTATARLLAAIARAPRGGLVLPGLDTDLDRAGWDAVAGEGTEDGPVWGHPQFMLRRLLADHLGLSRSDVVTLASPAERSGGRAQRRRLVSEIMRPAATTDSWVAIPPFDRDAMIGAGAEGLAVIEAADEREEALAVAVALRETLSHPGRTAALITPDRGLARRVSAELARWGIEAEDSAGTPLGEAPYGRLARLAAEAAALDFTPLAVLALLSHPGVTLSLPPDELERGRVALEIGALRGPAPKPGLDGLDALLALRRGARGGRAPRPARRLADRDWELAATVLTRLREAFTGFAPGAGERVLDLVALASRHAAVVERLTAPADPGAAEPEDPSWGELRALFDGLAAAAAADDGGVALQGRLRDYPTFFAGLARGRTVLPEARPGVRVTILGLLEARLVEHDRVVLAGLDEATWPPSAASDAFLNRPMRLTLGLSPPERRIGQTAHDFVQAVATPDAVVSRARKREGKPTVPSRFLERMRAFVGPEAWAGLLARGERYRRLGAALDAPRPVPPARRPAPRPGPERFPRRLGVTEIETLVRDPYGIHARHVLKLDALDPVGGTPSAAERGSLIHLVLGQFAAAHPLALPAHAEADLLQRGLDAFRPLAEVFPDVHALWWAEFERLVPVYLAWEAGRRPGYPARVIEAPGRLVVPIGPQDEVVVTGRADRVELDGAGGGAIVDFKTGRVPSNPEIAVGFSPQLTLEAAMLMAGGFPGLAAVTEMPELLHVKLGGRAVLDPQPFKPPKDGRSARAVVEAHIAGLTALVRRYAVDGEGLVSRPFPRFTKAHSPYDHLARVQEWSAAGEDDAEAVP